MYVLVFEFKRVFYGLCMIIDFTYVHDLKESCLFENELKDFNSKLIDLITRKLKLNSIQKRYMFQYIYSHFLEHFMQ